MRKTNLNCFSFLAFCSSYAENVKNAFIKADKAAHPADGKLHFTATLSHEKAFSLISQYEYQKLLDYVDQVFTKFGVDSEYFPLIR